MKQNFVSSGGEERHFLYRADAITALDFFQLFFSVVIINSFVTATNSFGAMYFRNSWRNVSAAEFKAFIAIIICLGYVQFPRREVAFDQESGLGCKFIYKLMSEDRFSQVLRAWHYENVSDYTADEITANKQADAFWAVTNFSELLSNAFESMWNLTQGCDIDEGGIPWRGRHRYRCFNNMKPWPFHFKIVSLNDAFNGYQKCFYLYRGKSELRPAEGVPATTWPIFKLFTKNK